MYIHVYTYHDTYVYTVDAKIYFTRVLGFMPDVCMYIHIHIYIYLFVQICMCICVYIYMYVHVYM